MKICFLCGSLEPGRNGVGDYSRRLAGELIRNGHEAYLVGINENTLTKPNDESQDDEGTPIRAYRWPDNQSWKQRFASLEELLGQTSPTHLSVQFVLYAFDRHGLPYRYTQHFKKLQTSAKLHYMVHELWQRSAGMGVKQQIISFLQSRIAQKFLSGPTPVTIHTSLPRMQKTLAQMQQPSRLLPIFSNINPLDLATHHEADVGKEDTTLHAAFFSQFTIHPAVVKFIEAFHHDCCARGKALSLTFIGGNAEKAQGSIQTLRMSLGDTVPMAHTGKLSPQDLSRKLHQVDFGISPVPRHVIGKSGTAAAFIAHGKAVAIPHTETGESPDDIGLAEEALRPAFMTDPTVSALERASLVALRESERISIKRVAAQLIKDLQAHPRKD